MLCSTTTHPFVVNIDYPHNYNKTDSVRYTKRTIVERMVALKKEADRNPQKRGLNHYLLGNAYYNMSWHGKYCIMSRIDWTRWGYNGGTEAIPYEERTESDDRYFGTTRAEEHYAIALRAAKDPVLKAMACRMAAECNNNMAFTPARPKVVSGKILTAMNSRMRRANKPMRA